MMTPNQIITHSQVPVTAELAKFIVQLQWSQVPQNIQELMPILLIDIFRAAAVGFKRPWTESIKHLYANHRSSMNSHLWFSKEMVNINQATFINGVASGGLDWDDSHVAAIIHPGVCIWPAAIAMAEITQASGEELVLAVLTGYETAIRIGMSIQPEHSLRGFQGTPTCGVFGAAAACAKLLQLTIPQTQNALGIAATFACGLSQFFVSGSDIKRFHAGKAGANGIEAALLAQAGLTGPPDAIEGVQGFARAFSDRFDPKQVIDRLGTYFPTAWISLKPHASSVRMQAAIEAAAFLSMQISHTEQIKSIEIGVHSAMLGKLTSNTPVDFQQAQLSTPFAVAMALTIAPQRQGAIALSIDDYEQSLSNQAIINLAKLCQCMIDPEVEAKTTTEAVPARVVCILHNGERLEHFIEFPKGCPHNPITQLEVAQRFTSVAQPLFGSAACDDWLNHAMHAKDLKSVQALLSLQPLAQ